ncbi:helix-turn-helix domain-containing protein [Pseudoalteromonas sp. T1lg23B]|uniref:helix-turn-helix domain-containing protein n=1 Tax=Pseudoalteromonas sp. T1lg23B TaxID=2077097 RepID=UPI001F462882|nr:helix-turn-helix transcriptional regulator [Pseudoalteromonas sp. T1lg23B]
MIDGEDLRALRIQAGITQQEMCKKLGCDRKTIINYELGVSDIPSKKLFRWLQCCKLDLGVLLGQIKAIRDDANDSGRAKILDFVTIGFVLSQLWSPMIITPIYLVLIGICIIYGVYTKNINMAHIAGIIFALTGAGYVIFESGLINKTTPDENQVLQSILIFGTQLLLSLTTTFLLIFRVQLSRRLSKADSIKLTPFDGVFHWIFIYLVVVNLAALLEDMAYLLLDLKSWTLIYDNFEGLIYFAWVLCCSALLSMMICSTKSKPVNGANVS